MSLGEGVEGLFAIQLIHSSSYPPTVSMKRNLWVREKVDRGVDITI
jgi:hypothetical protein